MRNAQPIGEYPHIRAKLDKTVVAVIARPPGAGALNGQDSKSVFLTGTVDTRWNLATTARRAVQPEDHIAIDIAVLGVCQRPTR